MAVAVNKLARKSAAKCYSTFVLATSTRIETMLSSSRSLSSTAYDRVQTNGLNVNFYYHYTLSNLLRAVVRVVPSSQEHYSEFINGKRSCNIGNFASKMISCKPSLLSYIQLVHNQKDGAKQDESSQKKSSKFSKRVAVLLAFAWPWKWKSEEDEKLEEELKKDPLLYALKRGVLATQKGEYVKAQAMYHEGLGLADQQHRDKILDDRHHLLAQINIFSLMATAAVKSGDYSNAEKLYKEVMSKCIASGKAQDDESVVELSLKLSSLYAMQSRDEEAETGFKFCIDVMNKKLKEAGGVVEADTNILAMQGLSTHSYARFLMKKQKYTEAAKYFKQSLDIAMEVYGADHPQVLVVMNDVATALVINKQYKEGQAMYEEAISRAERLDNTKDGLPALLYNLGEAYIKTQDFKKAMVCCKRCKESATEQGNKQAVMLSKQCIKDVEEASKESRQSKTKA